MAHLLLYDENKRVLHLAHLGLRVGDEVGGDVTAVELHSLHDLYLVFQRLAVLFSLIATKLEQRTTNNKHVLLIPLGLRGRRKRRLRLRPLLFWANWS